MVISDRIQEIKELFSKAADLLYKGDGKTLKDIKKEIDDAVTLINIFVGAIPSLRKIGFDVPRDVIDKQIENLQEGLMYKDYYLLADTFKYELNDTLAVIEELVIEGVIKDEELF